MIGWPGGGGPDNITCIVADVVDIDFGEDAPIVAGAAGDGSEQPADSAPPGLGTTLPRVARSGSRPHDGAAGVRHRGATRGWSCWSTDLLVGAGALARLWVLQQYYVA